MQQSIPTPKALFQDASKALQILYDIFKTIIPDAEPSEPSDHSEHTEHREPKFTGIKKRKRQFEDEFVTLAESRPQNEDPPKYWKNVDFMKIIHTLCCNIENTETKEAKATKTTVGTYGNGLFTDTELQIIETVIINSVIELGEWLNQKQIDDIIREVMKRIEYHRTFSQKSKKYSQDLVPLSERIDQLQTELDKLKDQCCDRSFD